MPTGNKQAQNGCLFGDWQLGVIQGFYCDCDEAFHSNTDNEVRGVIRTPDFISEVP
jgi:hypothetical protein